jgi:5'-methylthioadenosine phosphorylase
MGRLAVVGGHTILGLDPHGVLGTAGCVRRVPVPGGPVTLVDAGRVVLLQRHGAGSYVPAHRLDHHAHARALVAAGCDRVLAVASVGSLRRDLDVGATLVLDDFVGLAVQPESGFADERGHCVPGFDASWRARVQATWAAHAPDPPLDGGVYWQTRGPRFETPAEVRFLATFADVVGMTVASECVAFRERGLAYAAVCVVDNLANGIADHELTVEEFEAGKRANERALVATLRGAVPELTR